MENNKTVLKVIAALVIGLLAGYLIWGRQTQQAPMMSNSGMHTMPDGTAMSNTSNGSDMSAMMANMNAGLQGKTGDAFDQEFLAEMIVHHQGAVQMAQLALTNAKHQEVKDLAKGIITAQDKEITEMQAWQKNWYNQ